jgi:two-component system CheB/CheR fusion protein
VSVQVCIQVHRVILDETKLFLVTFADLQTADVTSASNAVEGAANHQLEQELETTRADLHTTIRNYELSAEELKAVNEEAMSMNEEFQSTNEELETSKEELQSLNEELTTLNTQLQQKIDDERRLADDLDNLLSSSGIATLFLDADFKIRRFTPAMRELYNLIGKDVGRPFGDITGKVDDPNLLKDAEKVLATLVTTEREVEIEGGKWFIRRILPYRTQDGKIDGVVVTFSDISDIKELQEHTAAAQEYAQNIVDTVREPLLVLDKKFNIISASRSFFQTFGTEVGQIAGENLFKVQNLQWDVNKLRALLEEILPEETTVESFDLTLTVTGMGPREMTLNARRIKSGLNGEELILLALEDVTERRLAQQTILDREAWLSAILDAVPPEAIVTIDEAGIIGSFSRGAEGIFGWSTIEYDHFICEVRGHDEVMLYDKCTLLRVKNPSLDDLSCNKSLLRIKVCTWFINQVDVAWLSEYKSDSHSLQFSS